MKRVIVDTGPIVAFLNRRDAHHAWSVEYLSSTSPPLFTCEAVLTEACHLLKGLHNGQNAVLELVHREVLVVEPVLQAGTERVQDLMAKYRSVPMALADACLVWLSEQYQECSVVTLDRHFTVYRRSGGRALPVVMPPD